MKDSIILLISISLLASSLPCGATPAEMTENPLHASLSGLPLSLGKITASHDTGGKQKVVIIQDYHCHAPTQFTIAKILGWYSRQYGVREVFLEGGVGTLDLGWLRDIPDVKKRERITRYLVEQGDLTGAEYYGASSETPVTLRGIEDGQLYASALNRLRGVMEAGPDAGSALKAMHEKGRELKQRHFNRRQKKLDRMAQAYHGGRISSEKYLSYLLRIAATCGVPPEDFSSLVDHSDYLKSIKHLRYARVSKELQTLMNDLKKALPYREYKELACARDGGRQDELCLRLNKAVGARGLSGDVPSRYPRLYAWLKASEARARLNPVMIVKQEKELERLVLARLSRTADEKDAAFLAGFPDLLDDFVNARMTEDDYFYFAGNAERFAALWQLSAGSDALTGLMPFIEASGELFRINEARNEAFLRHVLAEGGTQADKAGIRIVVTGGFHTDGLTRLLEKDNISYRVITPATESATAAAETNYRRRIMESNRVFVSATAPPLLVDPRERENALDQANKAVAEEDSQPASPVRDTVIDGMITVAKKICRENPGDIIPGLLREQIDFFFSGTPHYFMGMIIMPLFDAPAPDGYDPVGELFVALRSAGLKEDVLYLPEREHCHITIASDPDETAPDEEGLVRRLKETGSLAETQIQASGQTAFEGFLTGRLQLNPDGAIILCINDPVLLENIARIRSALDDGTWKKPKIVHVTLGRIRSETGLNEEARNKIREVLARHNGMFDPKNKNKKIRLSVRSLLLGIVREQGQDIIAQVPVWLMENFSSSELPKDLSGEERIAAIRNELSGFRNLLSVALQNDGSYKEPKNPDDVEELIRQAHAHGYTAVELYADNLLGDMKFGKEKMLENMELLNKRARRIRSLSQKFGIEIVIHTPAVSFKDGQWYRFPEPGRDKDVFFPWLEFGRMIGAKAVTVHLTDPKDEGALEGMAEYAIAAREAGMVMMVENTKFAPRGTECDNDDDFYGKVSRFHTCGELMDGALGILAILDQKETGKWDFIAVTFDTAKAYCTVSPDRREPFTNVIDYFEKLASCPRIKVMDVHLAQTKLDGYNKKMISDEGGIEILELLRHMRNIAPYCWINQETNRGLVHPAGLPDLSEKMRQGMDLLFEGQDLRQMLSAA